MSEEITANQSQETSQEQTQENTQEVMQGAESTEQTMAKGTESTQEQQTPFLSVKYNKEEKHLTKEEAVELAQKGMNYDKILQKYQELSNNPGLAYLNRLAEANGVTVEQLVDYWQQQEEQERLNELIQNNIPEDVAMEILESRKFRQQWEHERRAIQAKHRRDQELVEFAKAFPHWAKEPESVPPEIWQAYDRGIPLMEAAREYRLRQLEEENAKLKQGLQVNTANAENAAKSTGSVTGQGQPETGFYTKEQVERMSQAEIDRNLTKIMESMKHWK